MEMYLLNLKSFILLLHIAGLAVGIGGAWIVEAFILKHMKTFTINKEHYSVIEFISKFVLAGLAMLWFSGGLFLLYYYLYTPEFLGNEKVWAKVFIVLMLTINGFFVHHYLLPLIKECIGSTLQKVLSVEKLMLVLSMGVISFLSWLFPVILGVAKSLNFSVTAIDIILIYLSILATCLMTVVLIAKPINKKLQAVAVMS